MEEESDAFLLHKINVKSALLLSYTKTSHSQQHTPEDAAETPVDLSLPHDLGTRQGVLSDPYADEVPCPHASPPCCACVLIGALSLTLIFLCTFSSTLTH